MALRGVPAGRAGADAGYAVAPRADAPITIEIRSLSACADIVDAWSQLCGRALEPNPFFEPAFALAAAQHLISFRDATAILVWQGGSGDARRRLVGLIPCRIRNGLFASGTLVGLCDRRISSDAPLLDRQLAGAAIDAVLTSRQLGAVDGRGLIWRGLDPEGALAPVIRDIASRIGWSASFRPARGASASGPSAEQVASSRRALAQRGTLKLVEPRTAAGLRDGVEIVLAMEASGPRAKAGAATLQDTREVGFLRAMTRGLSHDRQCRVGLLMLDDQPVAGAIVIGRGPRGWLYLAAQDETLAPLTPQRVLLAMMRDATPARSILDRDASASGGGSASFGDLHLSNGVVRTPRDLAGRAREALRRSLFRPRRAGAA